MYSVNDYLINIIVCIILIYISHYIYAFFSQMKHYPPGPIPLPLFGNSLMLIANLNRNPYYFFQNLHEKYGDIYTFWLCSKPVVVIGCYELAKQAFNNNDVSDRCEMSSEALINSTLVGGHKSFVFMNFNLDCKVLRRVSAEAIRKYLSDNNHLEEVSREIVDETVSEIKRIEGERDFNPSEYVDNMFIRLLIRSTFGKTVSFDDKLIAHIIVYFETIQKNILSIFISEFFPFINYFIDLTKHKPVIKNTVNLFTQWYRENDSENTGHNICDYLKLSSNTKREMDSSNEIYLNESNIIGCLTTLFLAAADTSHYTFKWILLLMAYHTEMQQTMRDEINTNIGNKTPETADKEKCVFVMAFICETLRFRNVFPLGVTHYTSNHIKIGYTPIPKGTTVLLNQISILNDGRHWKNPECFNPERFIDCDNRLNASDLPSFIPFSTGKRMCIGDKFAMNSLFLVLTSFIQSTDGLTLILSDKLSIDLEPKKFGYLLDPKLFKVRFVKQ